MLDAMFQKDSFSCEQENMIYPEIKGYLSLDKGYLKVIFP